MKYIFSQQPTTLDKCFERLLKFTLDQLLQQPSILQPHEILYLAPYPLSSYCIDKFRERFVDESHKEWNKVFARFSEISCLMAVMVLLTIKMDIYAKFRLLIAPCVATDDEFSIPDRHQLTSIFSQLMFILNDRHRAILKNRFANFIPITRETISIAELSTLTQNQVYGK